MSIKLIHRILIRNDLMYWKRIYFAYSKSPEPGGVRRHFSSSLKCNATIRSNRLISIIFYGSDDFSLESLRLLHRKLNLEICENIRSLSSSSSSSLAPIITGVKRLEVVTTSANNQIYGYCQKQNLPCHFFDDYTVPSGTFDLGVVSSFGRLISRRAIEACHYGILNVHGSLLPQWRGASPIQHAILHGDPVTGVTIMRVMAKKFDIGQIVAQKEIEILHRITAQDLKKMMAPLGAQLLWQCIEQLDDRLANAREQPQEGVTLAPRLRETDGEIDWHRMDAREIDRRTRAFAGFVDVYTRWIDGTPLRLGDAVDPDLVARLDLRNIARIGKIKHIRHIPGSVYYHKKRHLLCVASANETWSAFRSFTLKGRKKMSALGFYNTFIRPISKAYRARNDGRKPCLVLGAAPIIEVDEVDGDKDCHFVSVHNYAEIEKQFLTIKLK